MLFRSYQELAGVAQIPIASAVEQVSVTAGVLASFPPGMFEIEQAKLLTYNGETVDKGENILTPISINEIDDDTVSPPVTTKTVRSSGCTLKTKKRRSSSSGATNTSMI